MIIECPACATRYDIDAVFPPEGRTVRCAKCDHKWRATPVGGAAAAAGEEANSQEASLRGDMDAGITVAGWAGNGTGAPESVPPGRETAFSATNPGPTPSPHLEPVASDAPVPGGDAAVQESSTAKVSWFGGFRRGGGGKAKSRGSARPEDDFLRAVTADTTAFARPHWMPDQPSVFPPEEKTRSLEEARAAVRGVFLAGKEARGNPRNVSYMRPALDDTQAEEGSSSGPGLVMPAAFPDAGNALHAGDEPPRLAKPWRFSQGMEEEPASIEAGTAAGDAAWSATEEELSADGVADPSLDENRYHVDAGPGEEETGAEGGVARALERTAFTEEELAEELETKLGSPDSGTITGGVDRNGWQGRLAAARRPSLPLDALPEENQAEGDEEGDIRPHTLGEAFAFDRDLYRQLEQTRDQPAPRRKSAGGLLAAAAWGLFLCIASGSIVALFAFRDVVADVLPGAAPVFRALGAPVTAQPLIFENVQYQWETAASKPTLLITGSVYNRASRKVKVPEFYIDIRDEDPERDREYSANLQARGSSIRGGQHAEFEIELVSPDPTITHVELELRNVR